MNNEHLAWLYGQAGVSIKKPASPPVSLALFQLQQIYVS